MKKLKSYTFIIVLTMMLYESKAQEEKKINFTLQEAIDYSLKHSPNYLNSELDLKSAEYRIKEITGLGLPQINGSIDFKDYLEIPTSLLPAELFPGGVPGTYAPVRFGTKYNATAGFSASQLIFNSDYIFGLRASKEFANLSKINVSRSKSELAAQVTKAYYLHVITRERIKVLESNVTRTKKAYENLKAANAQGLFELIDVERQEVEYNNFVFERDKASRSIVSVEALLKFQMGFNIADPLVLTDSLNFDNNDNLELSATADITKRPDYQQIQATQVLLDIDVKRLKWGYLPSLAAYGSYNFNAQRTTFNFGNDKNDPSKQWFKISLIGLTMNLPIFDGLQRHYKIQQAKIASLKNKNNSRLIELGAQSEILTSSVNYNSAFLGLKNQKRSMDLAKHVLEVAQKKYENGLGSSLEVTIAETQLIGAQVNYYSALYDLVIAKTDYLKATGTLIK
jgi:outer membrane protein TolC